MARVNGIFKITGSLQNVSFYTLKGGDTVYLRTKGGPTARRLKVGPEFEKVRKHQAEWSACVKFSRAVCWTLRTVYELGDFNVAPVWNGLGKNIMKLDTAHEVGQRWLELSKCREALEGYNLNRKFPFNAVFRASLQLEVKKRKGGLKFRVPGINTTNELYNVQMLPLFRLYFVIGLVADFEYIEDAVHDKYMPRTEKYHTYSREIVTNWQSTNDQIAEQFYEISMDLNIDDEYLPFLTALGGVGIEFAKVGLGGQPEAVKHASCSKIMITQ